MDKFTEHISLCDLFQYFVDTVTDAQDICPRKGGVVQPEIEDDTEDCVHRLNMDGRSPIVLVCEHASSFIPEEFHNLGLRPEELQSHAVWDPGAFDVATRMSYLLDAKLLAGTVSRLVYDCNRPPDASDAMPAQSERILVPGNRDLTEDAKAARVTAFYDPFHTTLAQTIAAMDHPVLVTIHSFTPVYDGQTRSVEIGVLHDQDSRLADAMLSCGDWMEGLRVMRNAPYGPADGVMHTLREHGISGGHPNVMIEIRNDLIAGGAAQDTMARTLAGWVVSAITTIGVGQGGA